MDWNITDAEKRFEELLNQALSVGPQRIHFNGEILIVVAEKEFEQQRKMDFKAFLLSRNPSTEKLETSRDPSPMRRIDL